MEDPKSILDNIKRENVHKVPDGYFDELPNRIQARIKAGSAQKSPVVYHMQPVWGLTAAAAVLFIIGFLIFPTSPEVLSADELLSEVDSEALIDYLYSENISTEDILASVDEAYLLDDFSDSDLDFIDESIDDTTIDALYESIEDELDLI